MANTESYTAPALRANSTSARTVALWTVQVLAAAAFLGAGGPKVLGAESAVALFDAIGIGQWFRYLTGTLEVSGALLLLVPALAGVGALLLSLVMMGAAFTEAFVIAGNPVPPLVLFALVATVAYARREEVLRLLRR